MIKPILTTKIHVPSRRYDAILRNRLIKKLNIGFHKRLTLISAPAGFGKTTLVIEWLSQMDIPASWLSLTETDRDVDRFLSYVIVSLNQIIIGLEDNMRDVLQSHQMPLDVSLTLLINEINSLQSDFIIILDDYHLVASQPIDEILQFLVEHMPDQMHLVITTREDPNIQLSRLRAKNQLTEICLNDLKFTQDESSAFLNQTMGLDLSDQQIMMLDKHTEGWVTGLQLAAISLRGHENSSEFVASLAGNNKHILDYLVDEILIRESQSIQRFLLFTSILKQLSSSLIDALNMDMDLSSQAILSYLEKSNLMVIPLDNNREWYRYHRLFADALQTRLTSQYPQQIRELHQRASGWYEEHNWIPDAIHHRLEAKDFEDAARLIQDTWSHMRQTHNVMTLVAWIQQLPDELIYDRPLLSTYYAIALLPVAPETANHYLNQVEMSLNTQDILLVETDSSSQSIFLGLLAFARAYQSGSQDNPVNVRAYAEKALELLPHSEYLYCSSAAVLLSFAYWSQGELDIAYKRMVKSLAIMQQAEYKNGITGIYYLMADIRIAQGQLQLANDIIQTALKLVEDYGKPIPQGTADLHILQSELAVERNELDIAREHLKVAEELGEHTTLEESRHRRYVVMARIAIAQQDWETALNMLDEAEHVTIANPTPEICPISAMKTLAWLGQGRLQDAYSWVKDRALSVQNIPTYVQEFEYLVFARILLASYRQDKSEHTQQDLIILLERLYRLADNRIGSLVKVTILQALLHHEQGDLTLAMKSLEQAVMHAEHDHFVMPFVQEREQMQALLKQVPSNSTAYAYTKQLLSNFTRDDKQTDGSMPSEISEIYLIDPLTEREIEILEFISLGQTNQEIADSLHLSLYTIKAHARNIYSKLDVNNRTHAVAKGRILGILPETQ